MLGGVPLMLGASVPLLKWLALPFWVFWDVATFCILTAMVFTRLGCLLNGCCAGRPCDSAWAVNLPNRRAVSAKRYPTQILEGLVALSLLVIAGALYQPIADKPGVLFLTVTASYASARLALEPLREDRTRVGPFDIQQLISAGLMAFAFVGLILVGG